jgi:hypothetical protein
MEGTLVKNPRAKRDIFNTLCYLLALWAKGITENEYGRKPIMLWNQR